MLQMRIAGTFLAMIAYVFGGIIFVLAVSAVYHQYVFQREDTIYRLASYFTGNFALIAAVYLISGYIAILYFIFRKPYLQMEEILYAAKSIQEVPKVELPPELWEAERELTELKMKIEQNERAAKEAEQRKNDLVVYLAHDLKTPLTSVIGYLSLLLEEQEISPKIRQKYLNISLEKAERLEELINEFFEITRFNLTTLTLEKSEVNLTRMLEQLVYEFQPMFREKNLTARLDCPPDLMCSCDIDKMQRVFDNLLRNAVNYSYADTEIAIGIKDGEDCLYMKFLNHGRTIIPEKLERIFEQFYRLDSSRSTQSGGAGLGLAITKEIIELHGGTIRAESENETVKFLVELPKEADSAGASA